MCQAPPTLLCWAQRLAKVFGGWVGCFLASQLVLMERLSTRTGWTQSTRQFLPSSASEPVSFLATSAWLNCHLLQEVLPDSPS